MLLNQTSARADRNFHRVPPLAGKLDQRDIDASKPKLQVTYSLNDAPKMTIKADGIANELQRRFAELTDSGLPQRALREPVADLLLRAGRSLNERAYFQIAERLEAIPEQNKHVAWFVIGIAWGRDAHDTPQFVISGTNAITSQKANALDLALKFARPYRRKRLGKLLSAGRSMFIPERHPGPLQNLLDLDRYQQRTIEYLNIFRHIEGIGSWNLGAMFWCAALSSPVWRDSMTVAVPRLPMSRPIIQALSMLYQFDFISRLPRSTAWGVDESQPYGLYDNNSLLEELCRKLKTSELLAVHNGLFLLGTRDSESDSWFSIE